MVQRRHARHVAQRADPPQDLQRRHRVLAHRAPLVVVERARLVEDPVGHAELADVVQQAGAVEVAPRARSSRPSSAAEPDGDARRRRPSASRCRATWRRPPPRTPRPRGRAAPWSARARGRPAPSAATSRLLERGPEALVVLEGAERVDQRRVEPGAAALARDVAGRRARRPSCQKTSAVCARQRMRPSSGISSPATPAGWPRPSQCSSSARIASAVASSMPTLRATSAPRSQRSAVSARAPSDPCADERLEVARLGERRRRRARCCAAGGAATAPALRWSVVLRSCLTSASALPYSAATLAAFEEQPASLSSSA